MGQQQLLLIILGLIMVGVAIAVGSSLFGSWSVSSNKDSLVNDLQNLGADAYQFRSRPANLGGGGGTYAGYVVPIRLRANDNGTFTPTTPVATPQTITFIATSATYNGTITAKLDSTGHLGDFIYTDEFL